MRNALAPLVALSLVSLACGGRTLERETDGGAPPATGPLSPSHPQDDDAASSTPPGTGNDTPFPLCPEIAPKSGWTCTTPNQGCAYVDVQAHTCASWTCDATGHWVLSTPAGC